MVLAVLTVGALLRWHNIGAESLWLDELGQVVVAQAHERSLLDGVRLHAGAAPLDYVGTKVAIDLLGFSTVAARVWSFLVGVLTVLLIERLAWEVSGRRTAAIAAACLAVPSAVLVFYSQEARFYSLSVATTTAAIWTFARADRLRRWQDWTVFALAAAAALYAHYAFLLLLALMGAWLSVGQAVAWFRNRQAPRAFRDGILQVVPFALVCVATALAFLPWYLFAARSQLAVNHGYPPLPALTLNRALEAVLTLVTGASRTADAGSRQVAAWVLCFCILALALLGAWRILRRRPVVAGVMLSFVLFLIPITWVAAQQTHYFFSERHVIDMLPVVLTLAAAGAVTLLDRAMARTRRISAITTRGGVSALLLAALVLLSVPALQRVYGGAFFPREDWRGAARFVREQACSGGRVYANLGPSYAYGIGLYVPDLMSRIVYLREETADEFLVDVLARYPIGLNDTVVLFGERPGVFVPTRGTFDTISDYLAGRGLSYRTFTPRIRVFTSAEGCATGAVTSGVASG